MLVSRVLSRVSRSAGLRSSLSSVVTPTRNQIPIVSSRFHSLVHGTPNKALTNQQIVNNGKRKRNTKKETEKKDVKKPRATKPQQEPEYLEDKRNLEDLWKVAFPVGIEWEKLDAFYESNWEFKNLEEALEEGGMLHGKKVFVFLTAESQWLTYKDVVKVANIPTIVVADSPFPPSDKIAVASILFATEEIIPMKQMKMDWVPYIPFEKRDRRVDRINSQIFILSCTQRRSALKHLKEDRAMKFSFCLPYFYNPFEEDVLEQSTEVKIAFPSEMPVICQFDWELDEVEEFVDDLIAAEELPAEEKDEFKEFLKEKVRAAKKANREAREARRKAIEEMSEDTKEAFQSIKFYKFYPQSPPDVSGIQKTRFISRCHRKAHQVL